MIESAPAPEVVAQKKRKVTPKLAYAIREVIEAARFTKRPPIKQIADKHRIGHQYLKTGYHNWTKGRVDLSRGDTTLGEPVQQAIDHKLEMVRDLSLIARLGVVVSDQLEGCIQRLKETTFDKRMDMFAKLGVERLISSKMSLAKWRFITEKGYLIVAETTEALAKKAEKEEGNRFNGAKEIAAEVVSTSISKAERFQDVFRDLGLKPEAVYGKDDAPE